MIEINLTLGEDDVEDILNALKLYEAEITMHEDSSGYIDDVLSNIDLIRERIYRLQREKRH
jgi:hypothetical protein